MIAGVASPEGILLGCGAEKTAGTGAHQKGKNLPLSGPIKFFPPGSYANILLCDVCVFLIDIVI